MRQKDDNPFVVHCQENGGELWACELPGREQRRNEKRETKLRPYCEAIYSVLENVLKQDVPYALIGHSMGTWMSYEFLRLLSEKGMPFPKILLVGGFPAPNIPEVDRPWNKNRPMGDPAFKEECKGWDVNEIVLVDANWKTFGGMMRDDFTLFDEYTYTPPAPHLAKGEFPIPIKAFYFAKDKRCKKHHLEMWKNFTTEKLAFTLDEMDGNHLFFYDVPARKVWMEKAITKLPF
jgi:surfactin synthase thioesterase subunit